MIRIALDGMGGDIGAKVNVLGAMKAVETFKDIEITIFGDETEIKQYLTNSERITVIHSGSVISMDEFDPIKAIRTQKDASLVMATKYVKDGFSDAIVSAGPTQAVVIAVHLIIKRMEGMHRVAIAPIVPSLDRKGKILLDVGANIELRSEHLLELAIYASVVAESFLNRKTPKVGLLNIGTEAGKGREVDKETFKLLSESKDVNFVGNIEPKELFTTDSDILITDGFTGNMILKTLEGTAKGMGLMLKEEIKSSIGGKIGYLFMRKNLKRFAKRLDASEIGGAMIFGINAPVIKAHGSSDAKAILNAIRQARTFVQADIINKVKDKIKDFNIEGESN